MSKEFLLKGNSYHTVTLYSPNKMIKESGTEMLSGTHSWSIICLSSFLCHFFIHKFIKLSEQLSLNRLANWIIYTKS